MIIKIAGIVFVMLATTFMGFYYAGKDIFRIKDLLEMKKALNILKSEIEYSLTPLPEAMNNISQKIDGDVGKIFKAFYEEAEKSKKSGIYEIWLKAITESKDFLYFENEDIESFKSFGRTLGYLDKNMQINNIMLTIEYIDEKTEYLSEASQKSKKLYGSLGILSGLIICIVLA